MVSHDDEIGVFVNDTLCVGGTTIGGQYPIGFAAWMDNRFTEQIDGFVDVRDLTLRFWDASENEEIGQDGITINHSSSLVEDDRKNTTILITDALFRGEIRETTIPQGFGLGDIYPNPLNSSAIVSFSLVQNSRTTLKVFDVLGREVLTLLDKFNRGGTYKVHLDGSNLSAGSYVVELKCDENSSSKIIELVK